MFLDRAISSHAGSESINSKRPVGELHGPQLLEQSQPRDRALTPPWRAIKPKPTMNPECPNLESRVRSVQPLNCELN